MRILMIAPEPFFEPRGTPISVYQRLHALSELGHEVDLLTFPIGEEVDIPNVRIHRPVSVPFIKHIPIGPSPAKVVLDLFLVLWAIAMLLTRKYDVIHSHEEAAFFAMILGLIFRVPHLYDMHSSLPKQLSNFGYGEYALLVRLFAFLERAVFHTCSAAITIGADLEEHALAVNPEINHIRIENVPADVIQVGREDTSTAIRTRHSLSGRKVIVYTGNMEPYQGLDLLFASAEIVVEDHPGAVFLVVGGEPEQIDLWKHETSKIGLDENVIFAGKVSLQDALDYVDVADILVSPRTEGLSVPLKLYSYMHSGKPMVATNIYAHTQILNQKMSVLVEPAPQAYATGICQLLNDPELGELLGAQAKEHAREHFSIDAYFLKMKQVYLSIKMAQPIREMTPLPVVDSETPPARMV